MPAVIGKTPSTGSPRATPSALVRWSIWCCSRSAWCGGQRHHAAPVRRDELVDRGLTGPQLVSHQTVRLGATLPRKVSTGEVVAIGTNDLSHLGRADGRVGALLGAIVVVRARRGNPAQDLGDAGPRRASSVPLLSPSPHPRAAAGAGPRTQRHLMERTLQHRQRHRRWSAECSAASAASRSSRPLRPESQTTRRAGVPCTVAVRPGRSGVPAGLCRRGRLGRGTPA